MKKHSVQLKMYALAFALALPALCFAASPVLTLTSTTELAGPPSCVVLNYTLADAPGIVLFDVLTNGVSIGGANIQRVSGDVNRLVQPGGNRVVRWFPGLDWPGHPAGAGDVTYRLTALPKDCPPLYMVVDLCAKSNVTYYADADFLPFGGVSSDVYRADRLAMRRVDARGVTWQMGTATNSPASPNNPNDRIYQFPSEKLHEVTLTKGFWLGKYEVTQAQWKSVMGTNPSDSESLGDDLPVNNMSWDDAVAFVKKVGNGARLPTDAEWEYACKAGTDTVFHWGDTCNGTEANCNGTKPFGTEKKGPNIGHAVKVGSYPPNAWGFHDMAGNVAEWCNDRHADYYLVHPEELTDPKGGDSTVRYKTVRGGCFYTYFTAECSRSVRRDMLPPDWPKPFVGFRMAMDE